MHENPDLPKFIPAAGPLWCAAWFDGVRLVTPVLGWLLVDGFYLAVTPDGCEAEDVFGSPAEVRAWMEENPG